MNIQSEVITLVQKEQDSDVLAAIRDLLLRKDTDWWERISTAERASFRRGIAQTDAGMGIPYDEAMKPYRKCL